MYTVHSLPLYTSPHSFNKPPRPPSCAAPSSSSSRLPPPLPTPLLLIPRLLIPPLRKTPFTLSTQHSLTPPNSLEELEDAVAYLKAIESVNSKLVAFTTVKGYAALETDYADWTESYIATASPATTEEEINAYLADQFGGMVELAEKKSYMPKEAQASLVAVVEDYQALLRDGEVTASGEPTSSGPAKTASKSADATETGEATETEEATAKATPKSPSNATVQLSDFTDVNLHNSAGRVGGVGALAAVLASGLFLVAAL